MARPRRTPDERRQYFVSYTTREPEIAAVKPSLDLVLGRLSEDAYRKLGVWYDGVDLRSEASGLPAHLLKEIEYEPKLPTSELRAALHQAVRRCSFTLALISPKYMQSHWCEFEWQASLSRSNGHISTSKIRPLCWKATRYWYHYATWTDAYKLAWQSIHRDASTSTEALLNALSSSIFALIERDHQFHASGDDA